MNTKKIFYAMLFSAILALSCAGGSGNGAAPLADTADGGGQTVGDVPDTAPVPEAPVVGETDYTSAGSTDADATAQSSDTAAASAGTESATSPGTVTDSTAGKTSDNGNDSASAGADTSGSDSSTAANSATASDTASTATNGSAADTGAAAGTASDTSAASGTSVAVSTETAGSSSDTSANAEQASTNAAADSLDDETESVDEDVDAEAAPSSDSRFDFATFNMIKTSLQFNEVIKEKGKDAVKGISQVEISVYDLASGNLITQAFSGADGRAVFEIPALASCTKLEIIIKKDGYTPKDGYYINAPEDSEGSGSSVINMASLSEIIRTITLKKTSGDITVLDRDKDGISDSMDEFPDDKDLAKTAKYSYVLAFEDKYPKEGFADFNDAVIKLDIDELITPAGLVGGLKIRSQVLAAGSNKSNSFSVNVNNTDYKIIDSVKAEIENRWNTKSGDTYLPGKVRETVIKFRSPVGREVIGSAPYDPYLAVNANKKGHKTNEIHLSFVKTAYKKKVLSSKGMPFALLLPSGWIWPSESKGAIFNAYPDFEKWYKSAGKDYAEWYLNSDSDYVFTQAASGSSIAGYLFGTMKMKVLTVLSMMAVVALMIAGIRYVSARK